MGRYTVGILIVCAGDSDSISSVKRDFFQGKQLGGRFVLTRSRMDQEAVNAGFSGPVPLASEGYY